MDLTVLGDIPVIAYHGPATSTMPTVDVVNGYVLGDIGATAVHDEVQDLKQIFHIISNE